ncbi:hypothetical protein ACFFMN_23475 [Planobispora siamensis]|uniref:Uncharacterized protein n=1 Tax=Planobispora siamensis TaxID=936338 RepID=A0A8J3WPY8_9ACTN|nr:hypothetical protein [Planobispora siamensis]GIH95326.1 hypothetical protein Psi01_59560 [Planobispora siamensis]
MPRRRSEHVCDQCGLAVYPWGEKGWRHAASGSTRPSCGQPPQVVTREAYQKSAQLVRTA